jgi:O-antigen/teichoic acid export membrane protein
MNTGPSPLSVRQNFVWSIVGNVLYAFCQWGVLVVLAKVCEQETLGMYLLGIAITSPVFMFAGLQLRRLQATDAEEEFRFGHYLGLQLLACGAAMLACAAIGQFGGYRDGVLAVILLVAANKAIETLSNTFYGLFQQRERLDRISKSMVLQSAMSATGLCAGVVLTQDIVWASGWSAVARLVAVLMYDVPSLLWLMNRSASASSQHGWARFRAALHASRPLWEWKSLRELAWLGLPLGITTMLVSLNTNLPRYFVEHHCGIAELGIFGALCAPLYAMHTLTRSLESSASARLAQLHARGDTTGFRRFFGQLMATHTAVALAGVAVVWQFGAPLLTMLFRPEYAEHADVFLTIMWATLVATSAGVMMTALIAARFIHSQLPMICLTTLTALLACAWLVPQYGMQGAALSLAISKLPYLAIGGWLIVRLRAKSTRGSLVLADADADAATVSTEVSHEHVGLAAPGEPVIVTFPDAESFDDQRKEAA